MNTILIAENNVDFAYAVEWHFEQNGFTVLTATTGEKTIELFDSQVVDILLLDINLDGITDGKSVARHIRSTNKVVPIIFMSGESKSPADVVEGLEIGANFFLKKPLAISEIDAHVKAALKMSETVDKQYQFGECTFIPNERIIRFGNKKEHLSNKENEVLTLLAAHLSETVSLEDILQKVWQNTLMEEALRNIISSLRKKIDGKGLIIETIKNKGYRLEKE
ncbi:response regulator transcription factor [Bacteroides pyogenes]|uniref:response regulator transcription factor n=1 Tax=Bacteroides pyogenes TaxID=310300 RepID=UPI001F4911B3|nr:response regulator transcription factor [Bacteroides pyogenes]MCF2710041.1 response regulator transcription factor [Bacteroides pyogenes]